MKAIALRIYGYYKYIFDSSKNSICPLTDSRGTKKICNLKAWKLEIEMGNNY